MQLQNPDASQAGIDRHGQPRPRLVLRVGVTGHRPGNSLPETELARARAQVAALLAHAAHVVRALHLQYRSAFSEEPPLLVAVSALAEGGDRIVAEEALRAGWQLDAVLPFARQDYEQDFTTPESQASFANLVQRARAVFEIETPWFEGDRSVAYEAAGHVMLDHADLVVAIWDGRESGGRGGTREIMDEASRRDSPVVWVSSAVDQAPACWRDAAAVPLDLEAERGAGMTLAGLIAKALAPPAPTLMLEEPGKKTDPITRFLRFLVEREGRSPRWAGAHDLLLRFLTGKPAAAPKPLADRQAEWQHFFDALPPTGPLGGALGDVLLKRFLWADGKATQLGRLYRSAYVLSFLLAALAVFVGLLSVLDAWDQLFGGIAEAKTFCATAELALILLVTGIALAGRHARWHQRFLDARALAELLRHARVLAPIGRIGRMYTGRASAVEIDDSWTIWYARATLRELPLPNARVNAEFLQRAITAVLRCEVEGQIKYHHANHQSLEQVHHRLDKAGETLFRTTIFLCLVWLAVVAIFGFEGANEREWISQTLKSIMTFLGAVLPAFAGALAGIRAQGDFRASANQSLTTETELEDLLKRAKMKMPQTYPAAFVLLEALADSLTSELGKWRLMFRQRPLAMPG